MGQGVEVGQPSWGNLQSLGVAGGQGCRGRSGDGCGGSAAEALSQKTLSCGLRSLVHPHSQ